MKKEKGQIKSFEEGGESAGDLRTGGKPKSFCRN